MYLLERISNNLADKLSTTLNLDVNNKEVLAYGAFNLIYILWLILLIVLFGILFDSLHIILIIALAVAFLRKSSGGAHATSPNRCAIISVIVFGTLSIIIKYTATDINVFYIIIYELISFIFTFIIMYKYCPVDSYP